MTTETKESEFLLRATLAHVTGPGWTELTGNIAEDSCSTIGAVLHHWPRVTEVTNG